MPGGKKRTFLNLTSLDLDIHSTVQAKANFNVDISRLDFNLV